MTIGKGTAAVFLVVVTLLIGTTAFELGLRSRSERPALALRPLHSTDRGLSYDALYMPLDVPLSNIEQDLKLYKREGASSIYVSANEADTRQGQKLTETLLVGHRLGLRVFIDPYVGGTFSGDEGNSAAAYLQQHPDSDVTSRDGLDARVPSVNDSAYREYVKQYLAVFLTYQFDGILLDEPTMAVPSWQDKMRPGDYFPYDQASKSMFRAEYGYDMPPTENHDVIAFRERSMQSFVGELLKFIKATRPDIVTILVLVSHSLNRADIVGTANWSVFAGMRELDVLETDPYWEPNMQWQWFVDNVNSLLSAVSPFEKPCGVWVQAFGMSSGYDSISKSLRYLMAHHVPWLAVWVTEHLPNADMAATYQQIANVYRT